MSKVQVSSVINAPIDRVWAHIRDFNGLPDWHPGFENSHIEDGKAGDQVGCVRHFHLAGGGGVIRERLVALSDGDHACTYTILEAPLPITNYLSTLSLRPVSDGNRTFAHWVGEFDVAADQKAAMEEAITGVYQGGFDALKDHFGG